MSAYVLDIELASMPAHHVAAFLPKPFDVNRLLGALHHALGFAEAA